MAKHDRVRSDIPYAQRLMLKKYSDIAQHRDHAALTAMKIGLVALNDLFGLGYLRLAKFANAHQALIEEYYADPDYQEVKLNQRLEQMGFKIGKGGRIYGCIDQDGNIRSTAELGKDAID